MGALGMRVYTVKKFISWEEVLMCYSSYGVATSLQYSGIHLISDWWW